MLPPEPRASAEEIAANVQSIEAVPYELLPDGPARRELLKWAAAGEDVFAYCSIAGVWNIWLAGERVPVTEYVTGRIVFDD